jgi:1-acyl-sn-glycerol-3-phosphate acyltransferase
MELSEYEDIRPYTDAEVPQKIGLLLEDPAFTEVFRLLFPDEHKEMHLRKQLSEVKTIEQLQHHFVSRLVERILKTTTSGLTTSGLEYLDKKKPYLFISNHRDIVLDAAFLNYVMFQSGLNTTQIAIGDNLLIYDWITHVVKLNRAFVVKRNIAARELLEASKKLSSYIRKSITTDNLSVWIAQREGRTKDGNDQTHLAILKMLNLSNTKNLADGFGELTVVPLSISYELEPCGISKVAELIMKETDGYQKTPEDDLRSMSMGLINPKGRVHFSFGRPILTSFLEKNNELPVNEFLQLLAERIDHRIHQYYKLWPYNYVAYELENGTGEFTDYYTSADIMEFKNMIAKAQATISYKPEEVARRFTRMYARPVENALIAEEVFRS